MYCAWAHQQTEAKDWSWSCHSGSWASRRWLVASLLALFPLCRAPLTQSLLLLSLCSVMYSCRKLTWPERATSVLLSPHPHPCSERSGSLSLAWCFTFFHKYLYLLTWNHWKGLQKFHSSMVLLIFLLSLLFLSKLRWPWSSATWAWAGWFLGENKKLELWKGLTQRKSFPLVLSGWMYYMTFYIKGIYIKLTQYFQLLYSMVIKDMKNYM